MNSKQALYVVASDPAGDDPNIVEAIKAADFVVVQELYLTETAKLADVVLPAQSFIEREGTLTNGERRVQRFYSAVPGRSQTRPDFTITAQIGRLVGLELEEKYAFRVMENVTVLVPDYAEVSYEKVSAVVDQWPIIGRGDLYYGGTSYENSQGLGYQIQPNAQKDQTISLEAVQLENPRTEDEEGLLAVPITILYDRGQTVTPAKLLHQRIPDPYVVVHPESVAHLGVMDRSNIQLEISGAEIVLVARIDEAIPQDVVLVPRSMGIPIHEPSPVKVTLVEQVVT